ncbi:YqzL family protein [Aneurinibacillus tyrosinisolvens]|uniref:YqzL family protein n=1 Tax=Aneurinibacillus tyrosinisolvens TaxID=1443435 RepID=UPI000B2C2C02
MMRDFYWHYFATTGCIDAYLLYMEEGESDPELMDAGAAPGMHGFEQIIGVE